ncbi:MAG: sulfurtransferase TusA family protein [Proteobacteria bacterium]|nr:sulfurtransferase TusA family protein [Pseudomonadota bacterium]MBU1736931.1 sulfurtransferase TusA family protein [Pseudomonadota bacterium]
MAMTFAKKEEGVYTLDVTGYVCPHPQIYTKKALEKIRSGEMLEVIFDNPSSSESVSAMCDNNGNDIVEKNSDGGRYVFKIVKG